MNIYNKYFLLLIGCICIISCKNAPSKNHGPIKLGDSSTIVTESDPQKLQDLVTDLNPVIPSNIPSDTVKPAPAPADTAKKPTATTQSTTTASAPAPLPSGPGLKAEFKEVTVLLPNIEAKQAGKPNLQNANGAVYTWTSGNLQSAVLRTTGNVTKVSIRYQSVVVLKGKNGTLPLESLGTTTSWEQITGGNGSYPIKGINENELEYPDANANAIRNAVSKSARARRLSSKKAQEWLSTLGNNVRAANQKPLVVTLRSLMFKIDGKDAQGKLFSKQIRIDVPM